MNRELILAEIREREILTRRTFHVAKRNAGFLGLGVGIQVMVNGQVVDEAVVYGDTLHALAMHQMAMATGDTDWIKETNERLPKRFQYPQPVIGS